MSNMSIDLPTEDLTLSLENSPKALPGFIKVLESRSTHRGQFAKILASGFLKFTTEGRRLSEVDSVQSFIELADLHRDLAEQAQQFLQEEVPFVYEDQQIQPLLLNFALYRLKQISRRYYFATLQNQPQAILDDLQTVIKERQQEYDLLFQHI